jgi:glycine/D-amino acid oxidase-like deaminating enzyme
MAKFPERAKVVIIGQGGIVGASVVHHLIERGWDNIVGIDKSAIPTDVGSTAHASDFCFNTMHDQMTIFTTKYSIDFYDKMGRYERIGGIEVARVGDDERMVELKRRVASGKAFGNRVEMITPAEAKAKFPLLEEDMIQGALWDPDAGLVKPRSQMVAGELVDAAVATGKLLSFANTACTGLRIENGRIQGVETTKGYIAADYVVVSAGLWGRLIAGMAGEDLPIMPVDHPLTFFKPYLEFAGTGKDIGYPLLRDQGNSAYLRDTGDPKTPEGGQIEWGYYEEKNPRMCHPRDLLEKEQARLSPSQRDLELEQIMAPLERAMELTPILAELGYDDKYSFNGLLQVTTDGNPSIGESSKVRGLWYAEAVWVKDGPGVGKLLADWMTDAIPTWTTAGLTWRVTTRFSRMRNTSTTAATKALSKFTTPRCIPASPTALGAVFLRARFTNVKKPWALTLWSSAVGSGRMATPATSICSRSMATKFRCAPTSGTTAISGACPTPNI